MSVYKRGDSPYWWMSIEHAPPKQRCRSTGIRIGVTATERRLSKADAERVYHAAATAVALGQQGIVTEAPPAVPTFDVFATWYDENCNVHHKGREREREILPRLRADFGHLLLTEFTPTVVTEWTTARRQSGTLIKHFGGPNGKPRLLPPPSARTVNREVDVLQQVLKAAVEHKYLKASPLFGLPDLPIVKPIRRIMSEDEERAIAGELSAEDYAILLVGLDGLLRLSDIFDLLRSDDHGRTLDIRDPKNGESLTIPISSRLRAALDAVPIDPANASWYFPGRRGAATERDRRNGYAKALGRACRRAQVPYGRIRGGLTFHWSTRRTGATRMIRRGGEKAIGVVQRIGGWKDPAVLIGIYQETITDEMRAAVETVAPATTQPAHGLKLVATPATPLLRKRRRSA